MAGVVAGMAVEDVFATGVTADMVDWKDETAEDTWVEGASRSAGIELGPAEFVPVPETVMLIGPLGALEATVKVPL